MLAGIYSLQKERCERHADHQQVQKVECVSAEGASVQKSSIHGHLDGSKEVKKQSQKHNCLMLKKL